MWLIRWVCMIVACVFFPTGTSSAGEKILIKLAGLAPEGSVYMDVAHQFEKAVEKRTGGRVDIRWYSGGVLGDEKDLIRLIKIGQIHGAAITGMGAGYIDMSLRALEIPFLVRSYQEADSLLQKLLPIIRKRAEKRGFVVLDPSEAGFVYIFTVKRPFRTFNDLRGCRLWIWGDDPFAVELGKQFDGVIPVLLPLTDLLMALSAGIVDCVYFTPMAVIAFQLHTRLKYMTELPVTYGSGWFVVSKSFLYSLPADIREAFITESHKYFGNIKQQIRKDNARALAGLKDIGIKIIQPNPDIKPQLQSLRTTAFNHFGKKFMPPEIVEAVKKAMPELAAE